MNGSANPGPDPDTAPAPADHTRLAAVLAGVLFVPGAAGTGLLTLASEGASRCLTYGEQCAPGLPWWLFGWSAGLGGGALLLALAGPAVRIRQAALAVQVLAECFALLVILSHA
ncbi:hypothetical protein [Streptomyces lichenis]|uniref:Uncharacterized protein n=1 Tax=Streptomyces lichenis TaxID=2306967 RepID=A0ABT0IAH6_9ACTN|nr:hypothetical protein [Streptomyces lichenis]MCK8678326.1 hypothetical protein [Streptomyces lichenis]